MEKDTAVRNQKVFITLDGYTRLDAEYNRVMDAINNVPAGRTSASLLARKDALEYVIDILSLPIEKRMLRQRYSTAVPTDKAEVAHA